LLEDSPHIAYSQSKTANVLFTLGLNIRLDSKYKVRSYAVHPGAILTDLWRHTDQTFIENVKSGAGDMFKTLEQGCSTALVAALDPGLAAPDNEGNGIYLDDCQPLEPASFARDPKAAKKLWELSEKLVGQKFSW
jgi:NAD(P)-dependent dehydrogenase (short-subunit alcohol dehydrogenase family)